MKFVRPQTFLLGSTHLNMRGLNDYLEASDNEEFLSYIREAEDAGLEGPEILISIYAKLCYKTLTLGKNPNVIKIRSIEDNFINCLDVGHGSVFEHVTLNFVTHNCSVVLTHELVRHRVGVAYSQESGRFCALDDIPVVIPLGLSPRAFSIGQSIVEACERGIALLQAEMIKDGMSMFEKKQATSTIRRFAPNGRANTMGWSMNVRAMRHMIETRTNRAAEWEIRSVFNQVADYVSGRWPLMLHNGRKEMVNDYYEWTGLRV